MISNILANVILQFFFFFMIFAIFEPKISKQYEEGFGKSPKWIQIPLNIIHTVVNLPIRFIKWIILLITFNKPKWNFQADDPLKDNHLSYKAPCILNIVKNIGVYLCWLIETCLAITLSGVTLWWLLPNSFSFFKDALISTSNSFPEFNTLPEVLKAVNSLKSLDVETIYEIICTLFVFVVNNLILPCFKENPLNFLLYALFVVIIFSQFLPKLHKGRILTAPTVLFLLLAFNLTYGFINFEAYSALSTIINTFGWIFVILYLTYRSCSLIMVYLTLFFKFLIKCFTKKTKCFQHHTKGIKLH